MPTAEELRLIHTNPSVRLLWSYLRMFYSAGVHNPLSDFLVAAAVDDLRGRGVPIPHNDTWWRDAAYPIVSIPPSPKP